jgi:hypothetical protein
MASTEQQPRPSLSWPVEEESDQVDERAADPVDGEPKGIP